MLANPRGAAEQSARHGLLLAVAAAMLWGTVGVASKMLPDSATLSSFDLALARLAIAAPLLVLFSGLLLGRALWANAAHAWPWIAAVGVLAALLSVLPLRELGAAGCREDRSLDGLSAACADRRDICAGLPRSGHRPGPRAPC